MLGTLSDIVAIRKKTMFCSTQMQKRKHSNLEGVYGKPYHLLHHGNGEKNLSRIEQNYFTKVIKK